jgi:predicted nucleotidyltransferase
MTLDDMKHDDLLAAVVAALSSEHTEAIVLAGSTVRGDATPYSDLDLAHIVKGGYTGPEKTFHYRAGRLVSVSARTFEWWRRAKRFVSSKASCRRIAATWRPALPKWSTKPFVYSIPDSLI